MTVPLPSLAFTQEDSGRFSKGSWFYIHVGLFSLKLYNISEHIFLLDLF